MSTYYEAVYKVCEPSFGEATKLFLDRQIRKHLKKPPQEVAPADRQELAKWIRISAALLLDKDSAEILARRVVSVADEAP